MNFVYTMSRIALFLRDMTMDSLVGFFNQQFILSYSTFW
jgi:hypothetical protein